MLPYSYHDAVDLFLWLSLRKSAFCLIVVIQDCGLLNFRLSDPIVTYDPYLFFFKCRPTLFPQLINVQCVLRLVAVLGTIEVTGIVPYKPIIYKYLL